MKRFMIHCFLAVALILGVTTTTVHQSKANVYHTGETNRLQQSLPEQPESNLTQSDFFISVGWCNGQSSLLQPVQLYPLRVSTSLYNTARINYLVQLQFQQFSTSTTRFLLQSAFKQRNGYYLYHLCKLLI